MALVIRGKTTCQICNKRLQEQESIIAYPDICYDENDPIYFFSGGIFHESCFMKADYSTIAMDILRMVDREAEKKICYISKTPITIENVKHPDNHIYIGYLTSDRDSLLYKYNYIHINKQYLDSWKGKNDFLFLLKTQSNLEGWSPLKLLIKRLESPLAPPMDPKIIERVNQYKR